MHNKKTINKNFWIPMIILIVSMIISVAIRQISVVIALFTFLFLILPICMSFRRKYINWGLTFVKGIGLGIIYCMVLYVVLKISNYNEVLKAIILWPMEETLSKKIYLWLQFLMAVTVSAILTTQMESAPAKR